MPDLKKIKGLFVTGEEKKPTPHRPGSTVVPAEPRSYLGDKPRRGQITATAIGPTPSVSMDPEFDTELKEILRTVPAPKGFEAFFSNLITLGKYIPDEGNLFRAALDASKEAGLTVRQIIETLQAQLSTLGQRQQAFRSELEQEAKESVAEREERLKELSKGMSDLQKQIAQLNKQVQELTDQQRALQDENAKVETLKSQVTARFESAYQAHQGRISEQLSKVQKFLGQ